jgi:hypothetical protein
MLVTEHFYTLGILALKISLGIFFLRVMVTRWQKRIIYLIMFVTSIFHIAYFFFSVFQCGYFDTIWIFLERKATGEQCIPQNALYGMGYTQGAISTIGDWTFAILPIFVVRGLKMSDKEKATVFVILSMGAA